MPKTPSYPVLYLLEFLLRQAREVAKTIPDNAMQDERREELQGCIYRAHEIVGAWLAVVERIGRRASSPKR